METIDEPTKRYIKQLEAKNKALYEALATPYMNKVDQQVIVPIPRGFTLITKDKLAALEAVAEAARKAEDNLSGSIPRGETLHEVVFRARAFLQAALDKLDAMKDRS